MVGFCVNAFYSLHSSYFLICRYHDKEDLSRVINYSPMGFVQARTGGLPLKSTYFISPQDKIDMSTKSFRILNATTINENNLGVSATIGIERSEQPRALPLQVNFI